MYEILKIKENWLADRLRGSQSFSVKWLPAVLMSFGLCSASYGQATAEQKVSPAQARALIQEWMTTERMVSEEKRDWAVEQESLKELIALYEAEIKLIHEELDAAGKSIANQDQQTEDLKKRVEGFRRERGQLITRVAKQRKRLLSIAQYFPQPLIKQLERDLVSLKAEDSTLRENVVAMLNIVRGAGKFNRIVSYSEEMQTLQDSGEKRQLRVLYLGLGRAYYLSGDTAGVGVPAAGAWKWNADERLQSSVQKAIAVYQKTSRPELVTLPLEVQN